MKKSIIPLYTVKQIKKIEKIARKKGGVSSFEMMQQAAVSILIAVKEHYTTAQKITILCGSGNNAGEGYLFAQLAINLGYQIQIVCLSENTKSLETQIAKERIQGITSIKRTNNLSALKEPCDLFIDALLGIGLSRPLTRKYLKAVSIVNKNLSPVLSLDIPSGLNADTGQMMGNTAIKADKTITFIGHKTGMLTGNSSDYTGEIILANLGLETHISKIKPSTHLIQSIQLSPRLRTAHKGHFGHALIIGGNNHYAGAAQLAAISAVRTGAGLVSLATKKPYSKTAHIYHPEIMGYPIQTKKELKLIIEKASVLIVGPGLGQSKWSKTLWESIKDINKPKIVDADALNLLAKDPYYSDTWILTPHPGEAARLLNCTTSTILENRYESIKKIQKKYGGICVLKGAGTLICNNKQIYTNITGNPGMASGGMGDVLAGIIGGLVAQKYSLFQAAQAGVYFHGLAADKSSTYYGERGLSASQLFKYIQQLINT